MRSESIFRKFFAVTTIAFTLTACGEAPPTSETEAAETGNTTSTEDTILHGSVGDGPIVNATINVYDKNGNLLISRMSDTTANYELTVRTNGNSYPLLISALYGTDIVTGTTPDFEMKSIAHSPGKKKRANINPYSTVTVETAQRMPGGLSQANVDTARQIVFDQFNFGLDPQLMANPITGTIDETNIAAIIKSSETFGEMLRRSRDALQLPYPGITADQIIDIIAADIVDGVLDGTGASGANAKVAAVVTITSAQVLSEAMTGSLKVNGADATMAMNDAITVTMPGTAADISTVGVNSEMLNQMRITLAAAHTVDGNTLYDAAATALTGVQADSLPSQVDAVMPAGIDSALTSTLGTLLQASSADIDAVNTVVRNDGETGTVITPTNVAPSISGTPPTAVQVGTVYRFAPQADDANGDSLRFRINYLPPWANFDVSTGVLSGIPGADDTGTSGSMIISVSDGEYVTSLPAFTIEITAAPNNAPVISGTPANDIMTGESYRFSPQASDIDGDTLSFSITNRPGWASFDTRTGTLSGTPGSSDIGVTSNIAISVTDGSYSASLPAFYISVTAPSNTAPVITGSPGLSVVENSAYRFTPAASDADGDALSFSVANLPGWASFDTRTGTISGTPSAANVGVNSNIRISVTDGISSVSLPSFSLAVLAAPASTGTAILNWLPPTENEDGSVLTDLAGFRIHYGTSPGNYTRTIYIENPGITSYVVENLQSGYTYYFVLTAVTSNGAESSYSPMGNKTIP